MKTWNSPIVVGMQCTVMLTLPARPWANVGEATFPAYAGSPYQVQAVLEIYREASARFNVPMVIVRGNRMVTQ